MQKRILWSAMAILSSFLNVYVWLFLVSCQPRKAAPSTQTTIIYGDTTRVKLVHRANTSRDSVTIVHQLNQSTVTDYEKSVNQFDSIQVALP